MTTTPTRSPVRPNLSWLTDSVAVGGDLAYDPNIAAAQVEGILAMGITHIFDGRVEADDAEVWAKHGITYARYGVDDSGGNLPLRYFDRAVELGREAEAAGGKILLHCHMGVNRGPSAAVAVLIDRGMDPVEALRLIVRKRPIAGVWYFMDAVNADARRRGITITGTTRQRLRAAWAKLVHDPEHVQHVQRAIADHNAEELRQRREVWARLR